MDSDQPMMKTARSASAIHLLVVEDDVNDVMFLKRAFDRLGISCQVSCAIDGDEAIEVLSSRRGSVAGELEDLPTHVLMDLNLPKKSGVEVLTWLRQHPELSEIPVAVLSSSRMESDLKAVTDLGVDSLWEKPISFGEHLRIVREIVTAWGLL